MGDAVIAEQTSPRRPTSAAASWTLWSAAFVAAAGVMIAPRRIPIVWHFAGVGPFAPPALKPLVLPVVTAVTVAVIVAGVKALPRLEARPRRAAAGILAFGVGLHIALAATLVGGVDAFYRRALVAGHGEFLIESVLIDDLHGTLREYEQYTRGRPERIFLAQKGPGVIAFFYGLRNVAEAPWVRAAVDPLAPTARRVQSLLAERREGARVPDVDSRRVETLRYMLAVMFLIYPVLTYLPVLVIVWVGTRWVDARVGLLGGLLYVFVPAVALRVAHLDFAVFPLLASATVGWFAWGAERRRLAFIVASALAFTVLFVMSLSALSLVAALAPLLGLIVLHRVGRDERRSRVARDAAAVSAVFLLTTGVLLMGLHQWLHFDPVERYTYARSIQRSWVGERVTWFVFAWNIVGYFLSLGLLHALCVFMQQCRGALRWLSGAADAFDRLTLSWLCLVAGLIAFGRQQGETDRLWAFLNPLACAIAARFVRDSMSPAWLWFPLLLFALVLSAARYALDYV